MPCRGRGGRGLKSEDAGPFLPADSVLAAENDPGAVAAPSVAQGPARPSWLQPAESPSPSPPETSGDQSARCMLHAFSVIAGVQ